MNTDPKTLHQLADQLETTAKEIREQANEQARNEILERVIAPGGIFHGEDWHKNFKWIINGHYNRDLVANEFDWGRFSSQMHTLASHPKSKEFLKNRFSCTLDIFPGHLSFDDPKEYVPFIRKYNIEVDISQEEEWEKQLETSQLVCELINEQKPTEGSSTGTDDVEQLRAEVQRLRDIHIDSPMEELFTDGGMSDLRALANDMSDERLAWMTECFCDLLKARGAPKGDTPAPARSGAVAGLLTRKDLEVIKGLVLNRMINIRDESPDTTTYLNKIGNVTPEGEGLTGIYDLLTSPLANEELTHAHTRQERDELYERLSMDGKRIERLEGALKRILVEGLRTRDLRDIAREALGEQRNNCEARKRSFLDTEKV